MDTVPIVQKAGYAPRPVWTGADRDTVPIVQKAGYAPRPVWTGAERDTVPIVQEAGYAPRPVWTGAESLAPTPEFDPRTGCPVPIRYTVYAVPVHTYWTVRVYSRILCVFFESRELAIDKPKGI